MLGRHQVLPLCHLLKGLGYLGAILFGKRVQNGLQAMPYSTQGREVMSLAGLVGFCLENNIEWIDCQQNTRHLASMGAYEIERKTFTAWLEKATVMDAPSWLFNSVYWDRVSRLR